MRLREVGLSQMPDHPPGENVGQIRGFYMRLEQMLFVLARLPLMEFPLPFSCRTLSDVSDMLRA